MSVVRTRGRLLENLAWIFPVKICFTTIFALISILPSTLARYNRLTLWLIGKWWTAVASFRNGECCCIFFPFLSFLLYFLLFASDIWQSGNFDSHACLKKKKKTRTQWPRRQSSWRDKAQPWETARPNKEGNSRIQGNVLRSGMKVT